MDTDAELLDVLRTVSPPKSARRPAEKDCGGRPRALASLGKLRRVRLRLAARRKLVTHRTERWDNYARTVPIAIIRPANLLAGQAKGPHAIQVSAISDAGEAEDEQDEFGPQGRF